MSEFLNFRCRIALTALLALVVSMTAACSRDKSDPASLALRSAALTTQSDAAASPGVTMRPSPGETSNTLQQAGPDATGSAMQVVQLPSRYGSIVEVRAGIGQRHNFMLTDVAGELATIDSFKGSVVALVFAGSACGQSCESAYQRLNETRLVLGLRVSQAQIVVISTDGDRDTPAIFGRYLAGFAGDLRGLTGTPAAVAELADKFQTIKAGNGTPIHLLDANGYWRRTVPGGTSVDDLAAALRPLIFDAQMALTDNSGR